MNSEKLNLYVPNSNDPDGSISLEKVDNITLNMKTDQQDEFHCDGDTCTWDSTDLIEVPYVCRDSIPHIDENESALRRRIKMFPLKSKFDTPVLKVKKVHPDAQPLKKAYEKPACVDISIIRLIKIENGIAYFGTGYAFESPEGYYVDLVPRSSCPKNGWTLANSVGIIDEDYRGEIIFALQPTSTLAACTTLRLSRLRREISPQSERSRDVDWDLPYIEFPTLNEVTKYLTNQMTLPMSLGQFSVVKKVQFDIQEVDELGETKRGDGAFGSSDNK